MVDRNERRPEGISLSPPDRLIVAESNSKWKLIAAPPVSLYTLRDGQVPERHSPNSGFPIYGELRQLNYTRISKEPLSLFSAERSDGKQESIMVGPSIKGQEVMNLLAMAAPYSVLALDTGFFLHHWYDLSNNPLFTEINTAHKGMPGWNIVEESGSDVTRLVSNYSHPVFCTRRDFVNPILRWEQDADGRKKIVLDPLDDELKHALEGQLGEDPNRLGFNPGMGLVYLSAYSPGQINWPKKDGFKHEDSDRTAEIGSIQVMGYVAREIAKQQAGLPVSPERDVQQSPLLQLMDNHLATHTK